MPQEFTIIIKRDPERGAVPDSMVARADGRAVLLSSPDSFVYLSESNRTLTGLRPDSNQAELEWLVLPVRRRIQDLGSCLSAAGDGRIVLGAPTSSRSRSERPSAMRDR